MEAVAKYTHSIDEFAELAGLSRVTVYNEIRAGKLTTRKIGRRTVVLADDARAYLNSLPVFVARQEPSTPQPLRRRAGCA